MLMKEGDELGWGGRWFEEKVKMPNACFGILKVNILRQLSLVEICMCRIKPLLFYGD